jgi:hypothetical protein
MLGTQIVTIFNRYCGILVERPEKNLFVQSTLTQAFLQADKSASMQRHKAERTRFAAIIVGCVISSFVLVVLLRDWRPDVSPAKGNSFRSDLCHKGALCIGRTPLPISVMQSRKEDWECGSSFDFSRRTGMQSGRPLN